MSHYFETPTGPVRTRTVSARVFGRDVEFTTAGGVFSGDGLDHATAVLLRSAPAPTGTVRLLDLGCGWGPIAVGLALACPDATVDAVDVNEVALQLTRDNAVAAGVGSRVRTGTPEQVLADEPTYDQIWSNPPIRIGKDALHALLATWLPRLAPDGIAWLVVGKNLGADSLQCWLVDQGWPCERVASAKGFRVLQVRPRTS